MDANKDRPRNVPLERQRCLLFQGTLRGPLPFNGSRNDWQGKAMTVQAKSTRTASRTLRLTKDSSSGIIVAKTNWIRACACDRNRMMGIALRNEFDVPKYLNDCGC